MKLFLSFVISLFLSSSALFAEGISAYLVGSYMDEKEVKEKLSSAGFEILTSYASVKKGTTIVFTCSELKKEGANPGRAHAAILRIFVDSKNKIISLTNPLYFGRAFMQDDYKSSVFEVLHKRLTGVFTGLSGSKDILQDDDISGYHFMMGMPYYEDSDELGKGSNSELISKARSYKKGKFLLFELKLSENSTLLGYDIAKRTKKFVKKIGRANGAVLPYCISVENGKATSLEAKYYLALSYPLLSMGEFTTIATVPGAIKKDLAKPFK